MTHMLKILSWNILAENCIDFINPAEYYPDIPVASLKMSFRYPIIVQRIKEYNADIVMLQEMTPDIREKLIKDFKHVYDISPFARHKTGEKKPEWYGNLTMIRRAMFHEIKFKTAYIAESGTAFLISTMKYIMRDKGNAVQRLMSVNVHFDAYKERKRIAEASSLLKWLNKLESDWKIVISGDFNSDNVMLHKLFNSYKSVIKRGNAQSTYLCEDPMIDYIYIKGLRVIIGLIDNISAKKKRCMRHTIETYGSDHHPVIGIVI